MKTRVIVSIMFFSLFCIPNFPMAAESDYPTRPVEIYSGYTPGAGTDIGARVLAETSKKYLGQEILVSNKPGGAGRLAMSLVAKAPPDGYTLSSTTDSTLVLTPYYEKVAYKPLEDFTYIVHFGRNDSGVTVLADSPFHSIKDLIEFARKNPDKLTIGTLGIGSANDVAWEAINRIENVKIKVIPFSGAAAAMTAMLGGHVMVASCGTSAFSQHVKAKKVRLLAILSSERLEAYPDAPTFKELGYPMVFEFLYVVCGPKNMPRPVASKLEEAFQKGLQSPEFIKIAKEMEIWTKDTIVGDKLKEDITRRAKMNEALFKRIGIGLKE